MSARVIFIGLDAAELSLVSRWVEEGRLPALAALEDQALPYDLDNCWGTLPTAVWPELTSGRSAGKAALFFPPVQLHTGETAPRRVTADEVHPDGFWTIASSAGLRVAALDLPWTVVPDELNGIFLAEWGTHDRWFGTASYPASLVDEVRALHDDYPVRSCDHDYGSSLAERKRLLRDLLSGVEHETRLFLALLARENWDLFACAFGQFQCVGHSFWAYLDASDDVPHALRTAMLDVYTRVDEGIGALRDAAGPDAVTVLVVSHGMGPLRGGPQLLPEVLVRLGAGSGAGAIADVRSRLPLGVRRAMRRLTPRPLRVRLQQVAGSLPSPLTSSATRAVALPADVNGYIRLNVQGREPDGALSPGAEAEAALEDIRRALLELEDPRSGERIVTAVQSAEEAFGSDHHPDVPDLMVAFRTDLGRLDACVSERVGLVKVPARIGHRSGDHTGLSRVWLAGDPIVPTGRDARPHALDVPPTILALLDVPIPPDLDGHPLVVPRIQGGEAGGAI
jgi:predicted AlkP superfamily phosphohydrolase/phosphomutase